MNGKLVRDKIPEFMKEQGMSPQTRVLEIGEFQEALKEKLLEEALEVKEATSLEALTEELADCLEVLEALARSHGILLSQVHAFRQKKLQSKGGFGTRTYFHFWNVESPSSQ